MSKQNIYFDQFTHKYQQDIVQDLVDEVIQIAGINLYYLPKQLTSYDELFGEDSEKIYKKAYEIEMMIEELDDYSGSGDLLSKFGFQLEEQLHFLCSKRRFAELHIKDTDGKLYPRPMEGDIIYFTLDHRLYEIQYVDYQTLYLPMGIFPAYKITAELLVNSHGHVETAIDDINSAYDQHNVYALEFPLETGGEGKFIVNEKVTGDKSSFVGQVKKFFPRKKVLSIKNLNGIFEKGETLTGETSGATWKVSEIVNHLNSKEKAIQVIEDNQILETEKNNIVDWDPNNPFA